MTVFLNRFVRGVLFLSLAMIGTRPGMAQEIEVSPQTAELPSAPQPVQQQFGSVSHPLLAQSVLLKNFPQAPVIQASSSQNAQTVTTPAHGSPLHLTRAEAEQIAIKNNPRISVGHLLALAQHQIYREIRSAELPTFNGMVTAVDANEGSRVGAGALSASRLLEHAGAGVTLSQLLTDFGRTTNLVASSKLREKAEQANALATTEDILMATDQAF